MTHYAFGSITRVSDLATEPFATRAWSRATWQTGDYVVGEVLSEGGAFSYLEWPDGHIAEVAPGDLVVGALGSRAATLELVGDWQEIGDDLQMHALTAAGVFGRCTSRAAFRPRPMTLRYVGHVLRNGAPARMADFVPAPGLARLDAPLIQIIGTSMECGKTTAARAMIRCLRRRNKRVAGVKLTGVARYRDILSMRDAGAEVILDFVDRGLPSTLVDPDAFRTEVDAMLTMVAGRTVDVVVAELGASPMEPYNGEVAMEQVRPHAPLTVLAAADLYAVLGAMAQLKVKPDLIVGRVASTTSGTRIAEQMTGLPVLSPLASAGLAALDAWLKERLD
jgi:hypothetical protein